jgi:tetratricopeptide (TPR) repeat protein
MLFNRPGGRQGLPAFPLPGLLLLAVATGFASSPAQAASPPPTTPTVTECETRFAANPEAEASSSCFAEAGREASQKAKAIHSAEALLELHPRNAWLSFVLGGLLWNEPRRSSELYAVAAELMAERGLPQGEVNARSALYTQLAEQDRLDEAAAVVGPAVHAAEVSGDPLALARARILESTHLIRRSQDLPRAYRLALEAREILFPEDIQDPHVESARFLYSMRRDCLLNLASLAVNLGRLREAHEIAQATVDLTIQANDRYAEAQARSHLLRAVREELYLLPDSDSRQITLEYAQQALAAAEAVGHRGGEVYAHQVLGLLTDNPESELHFQRCNELAETRWDRTGCLSMQARRLTAEDPQRALQLADEALDLAQEADFPAGIGNAWRVRMRASWRLGTPGQALQESMTALEAIELVRDRQAPTEGRAEIFTLWASHYHWLAGRLLENAEAGDLPAVGLAFGVQERMRARALIDSLAAANAATSGSQTGFASLEQARQALAPDEALLSFQIAPWADMAGDFAGGAWLTVVTRNGATIHPLRSPLAERTRLRPAVEVFSGLFTGDGDDGDAAAALYRALLADGLSGLGPGIRRLVIVPDDVLHLLPFSALRPDPGAAPLATRYEITVTPSATLWLRWRQQAPASSAASALVLADPASALPVAPASIRAASFINPAGRGELPWARQEGEAVLRHLGAGSRLLVGSEATEAYLKKGPVPYGILHFATHAWTSDNEPDRSFVLLAPGAPGEDGMLHPSEIVGLDLRGRIAVLSTCSSASGEILRGEGVMGLARAFFQAGASTVVATLWPLRDDDGADLFERFYDHLGEGKSVAAALQAAQSDRMAAGAPPSAWAGVIVLGDGSRVPVPGGRPWMPPRFVVSLILTLILTLSAVSVLILLARRRRVHA